MTDVSNLRNPVAQAVRNAAARIVLGLSQVQRRMSDTLTEFDIAYPESPLCGLGEDRFGNGVVFSRVGRLACLGASIGGSRTLPDRQCAGGMSMRGGVIGLGGGRCSSSTRGKASASTQATIQNPSI